MIKKQMSKAIVVLIFILFICSGESMAARSDISAKSIEDISEKIGDKFLSRIENNFQKIFINKLNSSINNEIKSIKNIFSADPVILKNLFEHEFKINFPEVNETIVKRFEDKKLYRTLEASFYAYYLSKQQMIENEDSAKKLKIFVGTVLIWNSRVKYYLSSVKEELNDKKVIEFLNFIGESNLESSLYIHTASKLLSYYISNNIAYVFEMWIRLEKQINAQLNAGKDVQYINNIFEFYIDCLQNSTVANHYLVLAVLENIQLNIDAFKSIFFDRKINIKKFSELTYLKDSYKSAGNTVMVDEVSKIRFKLLSETVELTPLLLERFFLKIWGGLTDWGTSPQRIILLGFLLYFSLLVFSYGSVTEFKISDLNNLMEKDNYSEIFSKVAEKFGSYAFQRNTSLFDSKAVDIIFAFVFHFYYLLVLGALISYLLRHYV